MHPISELEISELAAERAAASLASDDAHVRSGQLDDEIIDLQHDATIIVREAQAAVSAFVTAVTVSELMGADPDLGKALDFIDTHSLPVIHGALTERGLLGAFRLSDAPGPNRLTLCSLVGRINCAEPRLRFGSEGWAAHLGYSQARLASAAQRNGQLLLKLNEQIPETWPSRKHDTQVLAQLRNAARTFRDGYLAHHVPAELKNLPTYSDAAKLVSLTLELASDVALLVKGAVVEPSSFEDFEREKARRFWLATLDGPVQRLHRHQQAADLLMGAPSEAGMKQLRELHLRVSQQDKK